MPPITLFVIEIYDKRFIFYSREIASRRNTIKISFAIEILRNLDIA